MPWTHTRKVLGVMVVSPATRVVKVFSKGVEVSRVEEPKVKVVVGDTGVVQAGKLEGRRTRVMLL